MGLFGGGRSIRWRNCGGGWCDNMREFVGAQKLDSGRRLSLHVCFQHGPLGRVGLPDSWVGWLCVFGNVKGVNPARLFVHC